MCNKAYFLIREDLCFNQLLLSETIEMKIGISRFWKDGRLKATVQHEENSYFWESDLTECLKFEDEKLRIEVLVMIDWWNRNYHDEFEQLWNLLRKWGSK